MNMFYLSERDNLDKEILKIKKKNLSRSYCLSILLEERVTEDFEINLYKIDDNDEFEEEYREVIIFDTIKIDNDFEAIYDISEDIFSCLTVGKYEFILKSKTSGIELSIVFSITENYLLLLLLLGLFMGTGLLTVLLFSVQNSDTPPGNSIIDVEEEPSTGDIPDPEEDLDYLSYILRDSYRCSMSSLLEYDEDDLTSNFIIQNPEYTYADVGMTPKEVLEALDKEIEILPYYKDGVAQDGIIAFKSVNSIQIILVSNDGEEEYYVSPLLKPNTYVNTIKLTKAIPIVSEGDGLVPTTITAIINAYHEDGTFIGKSSFTIGVQIKN